jgi:hypothetical protein
VQRSSPTLCLHRRARPQSGADELRIFQLNDAAARAWFARTLVLGGLLSLTIVARGLLEQLGFNSDSVDAAQFVLGLALAAAALETVWRGFLMHRLALSLVIAALLAFSLLRMDFLFWLTALAALVPLIIAVIDMAVRHLTRPVNESEAPRSTNLVSTAVRRGARAIILLVALWALEQSLPDNLANQSHLLGRIVTGLFHGPPFWSSSTSPGISRKT